MILAWWSLIVFGLTLLSIFLIWNSIWGSCDSDQFGVGVFVLLIVAFFGWGFAFNVIPVRKIVDDSKYIHKFVTDKNIILEMPNGEIKLVKDMKYLNNEIRVIKITEINTYGSKTIYYEVK